MYLEFPNFCCKRLQTSWTVHSQGVLAILGLGILVEEGIDGVHSAVNLVVFPKMVLVTKMWHALVPWLHVQIWDPMLGLINHLQVPCMNFLAASLSWARVLSFVYLFTPINDHIIRFVILLIVCRDSLSNTRGCILEPGCMAWWWIFVQVEVSGP